MLKGVEFNVHSNRDLRALTAASPKRPLVKKIKIETKPSPKPRTSDSITCQKFLTMNSVLPRHIETLFIATFASSLSISHTSTRNHGPVGFWWATAVLDPRAGMRTDFWISIENVNSINLWNHPLHLENLSSRCWSLTTSKEQNLVKDIAEPNTEGKCLLTQLIDQNGLQKW